MPQLVGTETQVNLFTAGSQDNSSITTLADGGFVVVWASDGQDGSGYGVRGQRYSADGVAVGAEFAVNTFGLSGQIEPEVAATDDGGFVVVWTDQSGIDGSGWATFGRRFEASGEAAGDQFRVNTSIVGSQYTPHVAGLDGGGFVVVWHDDSNPVDGSGLGIFAQRYDATGSTVGGEFLVNEETQSTQANARVAALVGGGFVVTWTSATSGPAGDGSSNGVFARRYDATGTVVGGEFQVNTTTANNQSDSAIAALSGGGFVVVWSSEAQDGSTTGVYAQRFDATGVAVGTEFRVNTTTANAQSDADVAALDNGGFVVTWTDNGGLDGSGIGVFAQEYAADGSAVDGEFRVNTEFLSTQNAPAVTGLPGGNYVVTWTSFTSGTAGDGSSNGVFLQILGDPADFTVQSDPVLAAVNASVTFDEDTVNAVPQLLDANAAVALSDADSLDLDGGQVIVSRIFGSETADDLIDRDPAAEDQLGVRNQGTASGQIGVSGSVVTYGGTAIGVISSDGADGAALVIDLNAAADVAAVEALIENLTYANTSSDPIESRRFEVLVRDGDGGQSAPVVVTVNVVAEADGALPVLGERQVNAFEAASQDNPAIATLADGGYVMVWRSAGQDGSGTGIVGRLFESNGAPRSTEFLVNSTEQFGQSAPRVAVTADGGFVVVWTDEGGADGSAWGTFGQRFDATGAVVGDEFLVNTRTINSQYAGDVAGLAGGGFVVVWQDDGGADGSGLGVFGQRFDAAGAPAGAEFRVNTEITSTQDQPAVAGLAGGGFVVTWASATSGTAGDGSSDGVFAQRYDASGTALGGEFRVNTTTANAQNDSAIGALTDGGFVVVWSSNGQDGSGIAVYAQRYDAAGVTVGGEFRVSTTISGSQFDAEVVGLDNGGFVVTWTDNGGTDGSGSGVFGQQYGADGARVDGQFRVNTQVSSTQDQPAVTALPGAGFVVAWTSTTSGSAGDGDGNGVFQQRFGDPAAFPVQAGPVVALQGAVTFTEDAVNAAPQRLFDSVAVGDLDSPNFDGGQLSIARITGFGDPDVTAFADLGAADQLAVASTGFGPGQIAVVGNAVSFGGVVFGTILSDGADGAALTVSLNALASPSAVEALLEHVTYANTSDDPALSRTFEVLLSDGDGGSATPRTVSVTVTPSEDGAEPIGAEQQVNTFVTSAQDEPAVAALSGGGFVVVWTSFGQDGDADGIYAQRYTAEGVPTGPEFQVSTTQVGNQNTARVTGTADGGFVVSWTDQSGIDGSASAVLAQRFDASGATLGAEFRVNTTTSNSQDRPELAGLPGGGFVVVWQDNGSADGSGFGVFGQRYDATGTAVGAQFQVNTEFSSSQFEPVVTALTGGGFVVAWTSVTSATAGDGNGQGVFAQRYDAAGTPLGGEFRINTTTANDQDQPSIAALADGGFVVAWTSRNQDGSFQGIYAQRHDASGAPVGVEFRVNTTTSNDQFDSAVVGLDDGGFVVTWTDDGGADGSGFGVFAQEFAADGSRVDGEFRVNTEISSTQNQPAIAALPNGAFAVVWTSVTSGSAGDGSSNGVFLQVYGDPATFTQQANPVIDAVNATVTYVEDVVNAAPQLLDANGAAVVSDADSADFDGGQLQVSRLTGLPVQYAQIQPPDDGSQDQLGIRNQGSGAGQIGVSGSDVTFGGTVIGTIVSDGVDGADLIVSLNANATVAAVDALVENLTYRNISDAPLATRDVVITLSDGDGGSSEPRVITVNITPSIDGQVAVGDEYQVNTTTADAQESAASATLADGSYVVVWESRLQDGSGEGVYAQRFDASGTPLGVEFRVNTTTASDQREPDVAALSGGGFVVTWTDTAIDGSGTAVMAQRFATDGSALGAEFRVNTTTSGNQTDAAIAGVGTGFVVVWTDQASADGSSWGVFGQRYDAAGTALGAEFRVNTTTTNAQYEPAIAALAGGGFVVVWRDDSGGDGNAAGIFGQRYDAAGAAVGAEFQINSQTASSQFDPSVAGLVGGGFVVSWTSNAAAPTGDGSGNAVFAQRFDASGATVGAEFRVNETTLSNQTDSDVVALGGGGFVVTWSDDSGRDGSGQGVFGQQYDVDGHRVDGQFQVNTEFSSTQSQSVVNALGGDTFAVHWTSFTSSTAGDGSSNGVFGQLFGPPGAPPGPGDFAPIGEETEANVFQAGDQAEPAVAALAGGGYVVVWQSDGQDANGSGIFAQRFTGEGIPLGPEFQVNTNEAGAQVIPTVTGLVGGGFVVAWTDQGGADGSGQGVFAQRFDGNGDPVGSEFRVNTQTQSTQNDPAATALAGGGFVVTWVSTTSGPAGDGSGEGVYGQVYDAAGVTVGGEFRLNETTAGNQNDVAVSSLPSGGFVAAWVGNDASGLGVFARRFDATGSAVAPEFQVNVQTASTQSQPAVAVLDGGGFVVTWTSISSGTAGDGSGNGVFARLYDAAGAAVGGEFRVNTTTASNQSESSVAALDDGGFVVSWTDDSGIDGNALAVVAQRFDAAGAAVGDQFVVNDDNVSWQYQSAVAGLANGAFVATFSSYHDSNGSTRDVETRLFGDPADFSLQANPELEGLSTQVTFAEDDVNAAPQLIDADAAVAVSDLDSADFDGGRVIVSRIFGTETLDEVRLGDPHAQDQVGIRDQGIGAGQIGVSGGSVTFGGTVIGTIGADDGDGRDLVVELNASATAAAVTALVSNLTYRNTSSDPIASRQLEVLVQDGDGGQSTPVVVTVVVTEQPDGVVPLFDERESNTFQTGEQLEPAVASLAGGGYVVVWRSALQDGDSNGIVARVHSADGVIASTEILVNDTALGSQTDPSVAALTGGGFVVTWTATTTGNAGDGSGTGVFGQRFDASGTPVGSEFQVNTQTFSTQDESVVVGLPGGGFLVVWSSASGSGAGDGNSTGVIGQRFDAGGSPVGGEFVVNEQTTAVQDQAAVAVLAGGGFVVTWTSQTSGTAGDGSGDGVFARLFDAGGVAVGGEFQVNTFTASTQDESAVAALSGGGFVVVWTSSNQDGSGSGIYAQRYDAAGVAVGTEFQVHTTTASNQFDASVVGLTTGGFVVTWSDDGGLDGNSRAVVAQEFAADGSRVDGPFVVNQDNVSWQFEGVVSALPNGAFVAAFSSYHDTGGTTADIETRLFGDPADFSRQGDPDLLIAPQVTLAENDVNAGPQLIQSTTAVALSDDSADLDGGRLVVARITGYGNTDLGTLFDLDAQDVLGIRNQGTGVGEIGISGSTVSFGGVAFGTIVSDGSAGSDLVVSFGPAASEDAVEALIENLTYANPSDAPFPTRTYEVLVLDGDGGASDRRTVTVDISQDEDGAVPLFGETRVNTFTDNAQNQSAVASLADGGYVIVWHSNGQDGDAGGVFAQRYTDVGVIAGPEFQVNTEELLVQDEPVVAGLAGGGFVVVWTGQSSSTIFGDGNGDGVFAQVFGASGLPVGGEFRVNSQTSSNQNEPAVTALVGGGFVVTWTSVASGTAGDGSGLGVFGQRYDASGTALGGEFRVNTQVSSNQSDSAVAALGDGGFLVVWTSFTSGTAGDGSGDGVFAQRYDASGVAVGGEFQVNTTTASTQDEPAVAGLDDGGFVVVWTSLNQDGSSEGVYAQRYDAAGATVDTEFRVNTTALSNQRDAAVVGLDNGGFVVVWADDSGADGSSTGVRGQEFAANNDRVDGEFQVNTEFSGVQEQPAVAALPGGGFVVSFTSQTSATAGDGSNDGVFHQMFGDPALFVRQGNPSLEGFQAPTYIEDTVNLIPQLLDLDGALAVADADSPNFDGGQLSVTPLADQLVLREQFVTPDDENQDQLGIRNQGTGTGQIGVSGLDVTYEGVTIGTLLASGTRLVVSLNANADAEAVEALAENITYRNLSDAPLPVREFAVILTDGDGGASEPQVVRVTVTPSVDGAVEIFGERQVNQTTLNAQEAPASALLTDGSYVVVWESLGQDGAGEGIYARLFDANGNPLGAELPVNTTTADDQRLPDVAALSGGGFVVVWNDDIADGSGSGIFGQRFDGAGVAQGTEFRVNTTVFTTQNEAAVTGLADGGFVVTWTSQGQDGSGAGIYAQRYDASGVATGAEARVNTTTNSAQSDSSVSALADGGFVVVWADQSGTADTSSTGVIGQRFDAAGAAVGGEFRVNTETDSTQDEPSVTGLQGGGFVVTWTSFGQDGSGDGVFAQIYAADGTPLGGEFRVNESRTADQFDSEVVALDGGGFAVVYTDNTRDGSGLGVFVQQFNAVGNRLDGETQVNTEFSSSQFEPAVNPLQGGGFAVHWTSATSSTAGDGSSNGVFSQLFGNAAPTVTDVIANGVEDVPLVLDAALFDQGFEDVDGQNLQIVRIDVLPASGVLTLGGTPVIPGQEIARVDLVAGNLVYDGNQDFFGLDQFAWVGSDGLVFSNETALTNINLAPVNDLPVLDAGGPGSSTEGAFFFRIIDIQDPDPDTWSVSIDWGDGSIDTNLDTSVRTPNFTHFYSGDGLFTVTVTVDDNSGEPGSVVVDTFVVDVANAPPIARNDFFATDEDTPVGGNLLLNNGGGGDGDPGGDPLSIAPSSVGTFAVVGGGQITIASDGTFTYDPLDDFQQLTDIDSEQVTFVYTLQDDVGATDTATVFINISGISDAPSAVDDFFTTDEDTPVVGNVLDNDQDPEGDALFVTSTGQTFSTSGRPVTVNADGSFTYDPGGAFQSLAQGTSTTDTFTYTVDDGTGSGDDAGLVTITIEGVNDAPSAGNDFRTTDEDSPLLLTGLLGNDFDIDAGDSFSITSVDTSALLGTLTDNLNGTYTYDPNGAFESLGVLESDSTSFTYTISDGFGGTDVGTVTITVQGRNDAPIALDDDAVSDTRLAFGEDEGGRNITAAILGNDTDVDASDVLTVSALDTTGTLGTVSLVGGVVTYDPNGQFDALNTGETATDTFSYTVSDGNGGTDTATVTVTINGSTAANQPPVAVDDDVTTDPDLAFGEDEGGRAITADILGNDTDADPADVLTVSAIDTTGTSGLVTLVAGVVTYDPNGAFEHLGAGESTLDVFSYTVSDGNGGTDTATVTVTIDGANDAPEAVDDTVTTERATPVVVDVAGNDGDADGDALQASVSTQPANGLALVVDTGIAYVPDSGFVGDDAFDYSVSDGNGGLAIGQVAVAVQTPISEIPGTSGRDFLFGTTGDDVVLAGDGVDRISGDQGDDTLLGEGGVDLVNGGPGNDVIFGGLGRDSLLGGPGNDLFVIGETDDFDFLSDFEVGSDQVLLTIETLLTADGLLDADRVRALDTTGNDLLLQVDVGAGFQTIANLNDAAGSALADILFNRLDNETL
ncbi:MAG: tandem-95 repeat protein [Ectothiorhodospiraceae bacterium]|nr:tandem-95 repeat protein [Ectothiorhodospiraceae bacterium]